MSKIIVIELPFPISANVYWGHRAVKKGKKWIVNTYVTAEARLYRNTVRDLCVKAGHVATGAPVRLFVQCFMPSTARDLGNTPKVLEDALEGALYNDDNQIVDMHYIRYEAKSPKTQNAHVVVTLEILE